MALRGIAWHGVSHHQPKDTIATVNTAIFQHRFAQQTQRTKAEGRNTKPAAIQKDHRAAVSQI